MTVRIKARALWLDVSVKVRGTRRTLALGRIFNGQPREWTRKTTRSSSTTMRALRLSPTWGVLLVTTR